MSWATALGELLVAPPSQRNFMEEAGLATAA